MHFLHYLHFGMKTTVEIFIHDWMENRLGKFPHLSLFGAFIVIMSLLVSSCSQAEHKKLATAVRIVNERPDSAYLLLKDIEYEQLDNDKDRADYILTHAFANIRMGRSLITDTLLRNAISYYNTSGDTLSASQSIIAQAYHLRSIEKSQLAYDMMDSVYNLPSTSIIGRKNINKIMLDFSFKDKDFNRSLCLIDRHLSLIDNESERFEFEIKKITPLNSLGRSKEAVFLCDSLFALSSAPETESQDWLFLRINYAAALGENRLTAPKAVAVMEDVLNRIGEVPDKNLLELYIPMVNLHLNAGNIEGVQKYVTLIDNLNVDKSDYDVVAAAYLDFLKIVLDYENTGALSFSRLSNVAHNLRKVSNNLEIKRQERDDALESAYDLSREKYELTIRHQRLWLILSIVILIAVITTSLITYVSYKRRQCLIDAEEKIETLEELVKSARHVASDDKQGLLRKMLLQHLGIIKTFAEAPTTQNQEALRKISKIGDTDDENNSLVKWEDFYSVIDELNDDFHKELISQYQNLFSEREIRILCLMRAGFSTKEIGVLVEQTSNSIYVSKTSIRKKLGLGLKEDILSYLASKFGDLKKA